ncbi:MAG TPA: type II secretion system protein [Planctomycetes bacterium]|nr:type II secretion system protein [Planctomycetota bacterium]
MRTMAGRNSEGGFTLLEVMVAFVILTASAVPLLIALADSQRRVFDSRVKRTMKQLMEYKLSHVLLDRPAEDQEPIYVDGAEGNFGEEFAAMDPQEKSYWFSDEMYFYSFRIDSEEIDLGLGGGLTGEEGGEGGQPPEPPPADPGADPAGDPFGLGEGQEEDLGQLRYRVTLTILYHPGNANFDQHMSTVVYVKHPHQEETMSGPELQGGQANTLGAGEASAGGSNAGAGGSGAGGGGARTDSGSKDR